MKMIMGLMRQKYHFFIRICIYQNFSNKKVKLNLSDLTLRLNLLLNVF